MGWRISHTRRHRCLKLPENTIDEQRKLNSASTQNKAPNRWAAGAKVWPMSRTPHPAAGRRGGQGGQAICGRLKLGVGKNFKPVGLATRRRGVPATPAFRRLSISQPLPPPWYLPGPRLLATSFDTKPNKKPRPKPGLSSYDNKISILPQVSGAGKVART